MDGLGIVIIIILGFIVNMARGARKVRDSRPGQLNRPAQPQRAVQSPQPEVWRQLGQMLENAMGTLSGESPARQTPAPIGQPPAAEEGSWHEQPSSEGFSLEGAPVAQPTQAAATPPAPPARPMFTAAELRKGIVLSEILNRPTGRVRRWQPR